MRCLAPNYFIKLPLSDLQNKELGLIDKVKDFMVLDITNLEGIADNTYDVAVCIGGSINYLFDKQENAINEMLRIIKSHGKLILGSMSLIGALMYYLDGTIYEKGIFGIDATEWLFTTGMQDEEHYPVENKHYVHMMTSKDLDALFEEKQVKILEKSSAGYLCIQKKKLYAKQSKIKNFGNSL